MARFREYRLRQENPGQWRKNLQVQVRMSHFHAVEFALQHRAIITSTFLPCR